MFIICMFEVFAIWCWCLLIVFWWCLIWCWWLLIRFTVCISFDHVNFIDNDKARVQGRTRILIKIQEVLSFWNLSELLIYKIKMTCCLQTFFLDIFFWKYELSVSIFAMDELRIPDRIQIFSFSRSHFIYMRCRRCFSNKHCCLKSRSEDSRWYRPWEERLFTGLQSWSELVQDETSPHDWIITEFCRSISSWLQCHGCDC